MKELNFYKNQNLLNSILGLTETTKADYTKIFSISSLEEIKIIKDDVESEVCSYILNGSRPTYWGFINNNKLISGWSYHRPLNEYGGPIGTEPQPYTEWIKGEIDSPFIPKLYWVSSYLDETGDSIEHNEEFKGYVNKDFNFINPMLYIEYETAGSNNEDETYSELYILN